MDANTPPVSNPVTVDANARPPLGDSQILPPNDLPMGSPPKQWTAAQAKKVVLDDFNRAAGFRTTNIDSKWQESQEIYIAAMGPQRTWEGTGNGTPRANLQVHQAFQQVNALRPQIVDAICGGDLDFDLESGSPDESIGMLQSVRMLIQNQLQSLGGATKFQTYRMMVDKLVEDALVKANGVVEWWWDGPRYESVSNWQRIVQPEFQQFLHPAGFIAHAPTGNMISHAQKQFVKKPINRFCMENVDLTDFYIDPNCQGPNPQQGDFCIRRKMMTVAELSGMRGKQGWDVPADTELYRLSQKKYSTEGDTTKEFNQSVQGFNAPQNTDYSTDPRLARVEVLRYWQKGRHVWLIGRECAIWNDVNIYNSFPFFNWCYVNKPGSFYGFSIPELLRTDQELVRQLLNGRLDELALILHPPFISKRGTFRSQSQSKMRPGANMEVDDPKNDLIRMEMGNVTSQAFIEVDAAENRAQKVTGVTDLAVLGTPSSGGNSANRTATGVTAQTTASSSRVHGLVAYLEDSVIQGMLEQLWELIRMYFTPDDVQRVLGQTLELDPVDVLNADPKIIMKTASRMKMRAALQNGGIQALMQFVLNPEIGTLMEEQQGKTVDIEALSELYCDTFNVRAFNLFRPMTPPEAQASQQRKQSGGQEKMALQQARLQQMSADGQERDEAKIMTALITALGAAGLLNRTMGLAAPIELEAKRLEQEIQGGQFDAQPAGAQ